MNFEFFIAKRLLKEENSSFSKPIVRIATLSIALSIAVMNQRQNHRIYFPHSHQSVFVE